ncbi:diadenylate cyclase CdaA [Gangjinia marincola]|uniref:Diadenylate cyclase n=1 Tax=Gangjinia marincola TaxID=578463 RepID=A0ABN1MJZ2_9FLAO
MDFLELRILDIIDIIFVAVLLYYIYKLVKGTAAINIFIGIVIIYLIWKLTQLLQMQMLSSVLGEFIGVGMFALIVVFQQEIRKFLLMIGSTNLASKDGLFKSFKFFNSATETINNIPIIISACEKLAQTKTGALMVIKRNTKLDFVKDTGDSMNAEVNQPILEAIFYKNSPLHDGAVIIEDNKITATRVVLPLSSDRNIPARFGLRHRAAIGITERTDAVALIVSEETGQIAYIKNGRFVTYTSTQQLIEKLKTDLS